MGNARAARPGAAEHAATMPGKGVVVVVLGNASPVSRETVRGLRFVLCSCALGQSI